MQPTVRSELCRVEAVPKKGEHKVASRWHRKQVSHLKTVAPSYLTTKLDWTEHSQIGEVHLKGESSNSSRCEG